jgi:hypothetical protein
MRRFVVVLTVWAMGLVGVLASVALPISTASATAQAAAAPLSHSGASSTLTPSRLPVKPLVGSASAATLRGAAVSAPAGYVSLPATRLLDTRDGVGAPQGPVPAKGTVHLQVSGQGGVPAGVSAVVLNVTLTAPTSGGFVTVYRDGDPVPGTSNINFVKGQTVPNLVIAPVGADGSVALYNGSGGTVQLVADVSGYYLSGAPSAAGAFGSLPASRWLDTRDGVGAPQGPVPAKGTVHLQVSGQGGVPAGVSAVVLNVTLTAPTSGGFVTVYRDGDPVPGTSNINFVKGQTVPNLVIAPVGADGSVALYNGSGGTVQLIADVSGYYLSGAPSAAGAFGSLPATRLLDTRDGVGAAKMAVPAGGTVYLQVTGRGGVPAGVSAVVLNVTVTEPTISGLITSYADGTTRPSTSNLNFVTAQTAANLAIAPVGPGGTVALRNGSAGAIQLIADVSGYYVGDGGTIAAFTVSGLDLHDGTVLQYGGTYYLYGTRYGCGFQWSVPGTPWCGFGVATASSLAGPWTFQKLLFAPSALDNWGSDTGKTWNWVCGSTGAGCFNPRMLLRTDGVWVLWFNAPRDYLAYSVNGYYAMGCNGPVGPCGYQAGAPHGSTHKPNFSICTYHGDFSVLTNGASAAILCSMGGGGGISEEVLDGSWTNGTGVGTAFMAGIGPRAAGVVTPASIIAIGEGVGGYEQADGTWAMTYALPGCAYCTGPPDLKRGQVQTGYATAPSMTGPWTAQGVLSPAYCTGQPRTIFGSADQAYEWVDRWSGTLNETQAPIRLEPMTASPWSCQ